MIEMFVDRQVEVLRARLGKDVLTPAAGPAHLLECVGRRQVDDVERCTRDLGEGSGPVDRFALEPGRSGTAVPHRLRSAGLDRLVA